MSTTYRFHVPSLYCGACEKRVKAWFAEDDNVLTLSVDVATHTVTITSPADDLDAYFRQALGDSGYRADAQLSH